MILILSDNKEIGENFKDFYFRLGLPSLSTDLHSFHSRIDSKFRAIIILLGSNEAPDCDEEFIRSLRLLFNNTPIFMIKKPPLPPKNTLEEINCVLNIPLAPSLVLEEIHSYQESNRLPKCGVYRLSGLDASLDLKIPTYHGALLPLTAGEKMILRVLIRFYPTPISTSRIIDYAFLKSKIPEKSNIRAHICGINKKFHQVAQRKLIEPADDRRGYIIQTPEIIDSKKIK